jgi:hypothetical protein
MAHSQQKFLAEINIVRRWIAVAVSTLPGIPAQRARYLSEYFLVFATVQERVTGNPHSADNLPRAAVSQT